MSDPKVDSWQQAGTITMWKNRDSKREEWNITADDAGCDSLQQLLRLMMAADWPTKRSIALRKTLRPTDFGGTKSMYSTETLTLKYPKDRVPNHHWQVIEENRNVTLEIGLDRLNELSAAVEKIKAGEGDYAIGDHDHIPLWIWWWVDGCA